MNRFHSSFLLMMVAVALLVGCKRNASVDTNITPIANAGPDQELEYAGAPVTVTLDGSGSRDPDGSIVRYSWFSNDAAAAPDPDDVVQPTLSLEMGWHSFTLWVVDDHGHTSAPDSVVVAVGVPIDQMPVAPDADADDDADGGADSYAPDPACLDLSTRPDGPCKDCECTPSAMGGCADELANCLANPDATYTMLCTAVFDCAITNNCSGAACFTPCGTQITESANGDPMTMCVPEMPELSACSGSSALSACRAANCMAACM